jgi:hypothetical protein
MTRDRKLLWMMLAIAGLSQMVMFIMIYDVSSLPSRAEVSADLGHCTADLTRMYQWYFHEHPGKAI